MRSLIERKKITVLLLITTPLKSDGLKRDSKSKTFHKKSILQILVNMKVINFLVQETTMFKEDWDI